MQEFDIVFRSFSDVQKFVLLSSEQPFEVFVDSGSQRVDAKSFMVMFSLDYRRDLRVTAECSPEEMEIFRRQVMEALGK